MMYTTVNNLTGHTGFWMEGGGEFLATTYNPYTRSLNRTVKQN